MTNVELIGVHLSILRQLHDPEVPTCAKAP